MGVETERKYTVKDLSFIEQATDKKKMVQGYFQTKKGLTLRVRISDSNAYLTIKGKRFKGKIGRPEYEYAIPIKDAEEMLASFCDTRIVEKTRYIVPYAGFIWECDVFEGRHTGLVVAEIEIPDEDTKYDLPPWVECDVTKDNHFSNGYLSKH